MTSKTKNVYIDKLPELLKEYSNTIPRISKIKLADVKRKKYIEFAVEKSVNLRLVIMYRSHSRKTYSERVVKEIWQKKCLWFMKLKM